MSVRKIPVQSRSVAGYFHSVKNNRIVEFESQLEKNFFYLLEFDDEVLEYESQPVKIEGTFNGRKVTYIPDVLVYRKNHTEQLVEVKYTKELYTENTKKREKLQNRTKTIEAYCQQRNMEFLFFTEKDIDPTYFQNIKFLYQYSNEPRDHYKYKDRILESCINFTSPAKILDSLSEGDFEKMQLLPSIWHMVYTKEIETNLHIPLTNASKIKAAK